MRDSKIKIKKTNNTKNPSNSYKKKRKHHFPNSLVPGLLIKLEKIQKVSYHNSIKTKHSRVAAFESMIKTEKNRAIAARVIIVNVKKKKEKKLHGNERLYKLR